MNLTVMQSISADIEAELAIAGVQRRENWTHALPGSAVSFVTTEEPIARPFDCPAGYFCPASLGTGCGESGVSRCPCPAGSYCPVRSAIPVACGSPEYYCPAKSGTRTPVPVGAHSVPHNGSSANRTAFAWCDSGHYCERGERFECPEGTYAKSSKQAE